MYCAASATLKLIFNSADTFMPTIYQVRKFRVFFILTQDNIISEVEVDVEYDFRQFTYMSEKIWTR